MKEYEIERQECLKIINEILKKSNNQDLKTILDALNEIGFNITRPTIGG